MTELCDPKRIRPMLSIKKGGNAKVGKAHCRYFATIHPRIHESALCNGLGSFYMCIDYQKCKEILREKKVAKPAPTRAQVVARIMALRRAR